MKLMKVYLSVVTFALISACSDTNIIIPGGSPTGPSITTNPTNPNNPNNPTNPVGSVRIEYRVTGNASGAVVRFSDSLNGLSQITTTLPYFVNMVSTQPAVFLSLEATPVGYGFAITNPFMAVQIFINGILFREATAATFLLQTLSVSGTYRQSQ